MSDWGSGVIDAKVLAHLEGKGISCAVIGALALAAHGAPRYSADVDLMVMDPSILSPSFWEGHGLGNVDIRSGESDDPLGGVVRFEGTLPLDVIVGKSRAARFALDNAMHHPQLPCKVVTPLGLALLKLEAGGMSDLQDLAMLREAQHRLTGWNLHQAVESQLPLLKQDAQNNWKKFLRRFSNESSEA
jgi:hypothetical protein